VARYALLLRICENPETMTAALLAEARQMEDRLGLSPMAMLRLRWEIQEDQVAEKRAQKSKPRRRLVVVDDAVARGK
jgi:hypothetical protein